MKINYKNIWIVWIFLFLGIQPATSQDFLGLEHIIIPEDINSGLRRMTRDSEEGNLTATHMLASHYLVGLGYDQDIDKAISLYRKSAEAGYRYSQVMMLNILENTGNYYLEVDEVIRWLEKAATNGSAAANLGLSELYRTNHFIKADAEKSLEYLMNVANAPLHDVSKKPRRYKQFMNNPDIVSVSTYGLGSVTAVSNGPGPIRLVSKMKRDIQLYSKRLRGVYEVVDYLFKRKENQATLVAQYNLGNAYERGLWGLSIDKKAAYDWYNRSAQGKYVKAIHSNAFFLEEGIVVDQNMKAAIELYKEAADMDYPNSLVRLGAIYQLGKGVKKNSKKAVKYYKDALKLDPDNQIALRDMGLLLMMGEGIKKNEKKAFESMAKSAELGDIYAIENLADYFYEGKGVDKDLIHSYKWLMIASKLDGNNIDQKLNNLTNSMSKEEIAEATQRAEEWLQNKKT